MPLDKKVILERLSLIKYFYFTGLEESKHVYPLSSKSILTFQDAVELFLELTAEQVGKTKSDIAFMSYFDMLSPSVPSLSLSKASMKRLNKMRVSLKHDGINPPEDEIINIIPAIDDFFINTTVEAFGIDFEKISLIDLVQFDKCKSYLQDAQSYINEEKVIESLSNSAIAFEMLIVDVESRYRSKFNMSPYFFCRIRPYTDRPFQRIGDLFEKEMKSHPEMRSVLRVFEKYIFNIAESVEEIQNELKILSIGIDYQKYFRFKLYTPYTFMPNSGTPHITKRKSWEHEENLPSKEDAQFCFNFVIECALKLQKYISHI